MLSHRSTLKGHMLTYSEKARCLLFSAVAVAAVHAAVVVVAVAIDVALLLVLFLLLPLLLMSLRYWFCFCCYTKRATSTATATTAIPNCLQKVLPHQLESVQSSASFAIISSQQ